MKKIKTNYNNRRPHITPIGHTFFVTFRLADSLPRSKIRTLVKEMDLKIEDLGKSKPEGYLNAMRLVRAKVYDRFKNQLDTKPYGNCYLKKVEVAEIVKRKLHEFDNDKYNLLAYCIMPNHVHLLIDTSFQVEDAKGFRLETVPKDFVQLHEIMRLIKGSTAFYANKILGRKGQFWAKDSYDHYIRDDFDFNNTLKYIVMNPVKAGLVKSWKAYPYTYISRMEK